MDHVVFLFAFSIFILFHIRSSDFNVIVISAQMDVVKALFHVFPKVQPSCFKMVPLGMGFASYRKCSPSVLRGHPVTVYPRISPLE